MRLQIDTPDALARQAGETYAVVSCFGATLYGGDVSMFAGQTRELLFTVTRIGSRKNAMLDAISFSSVGVPEPGTFTLAAHGLIALGWQLRKRTLS